MAGARPDKSCLVASCRYIVRAVAMPEIPGLPGQVRPTLGVELTGGFGSGSPKQIKLVYGVNTAALGLFQ